MKKMIMIIVAIIVMATMTTAATAAEATSNPALSYCEGLGIMNGENPNKYATRAEVATVIYRALGCPIEAEDFLNHVSYCFLVSFWDVQNSEWFYEPFRVLVAAADSKIIGWETYGAKIAAHPNESAQYNWARNLLGAFILQMNIPEKSGLITRAELAEMVYKTATEGVGLHIPGWEQTKPGILTPYAGWTRPASTSSGPIQVQTKDSH